MKEFRNLRPDEIDIRVQSIVPTASGAGAIMLLYKDARVDMRMLDEAVGPLNWQRKHEVVNGNLYCEVGIYNEKTKEWVFKQDVGTQSKTEGEKGEASDSFKRACTNWGIGRELYTSPFIWINLDDRELNKNGQKVQLKKGIKFTVSDIETIDGAISHLVIMDSENNIRYKTGGLSTKEMNSRNEEIKKTAMLKSAFEIATEWGLIPVISDFLQSKGKEEGKLLSYQEAAELLEVLNTKSEKVKTEKENKLKEKAIEKAQKKAIQNNSSTDVKK